MRTEDQRHIETVERDLELNKARYEEELGRREALLERAKQINREHEKTISEHETTISVHETTISEKSLVINQQVKEINLLTDYIQFLNVNKRVAQIEVLSKEDIVVTDQFGQRKVVRWKLRFQEFDQSGKPVDEPLIGSIIGNVVKVEAFTIQWDYTHPDLEVDYAHSLVFIRRLYGSEEPANRSTFIVDENGKMPKAYGSDLSPEVLELVEDFWDIANDPQRRDAHGISFIGLQAPGIELREGLTYELEVRQSGAPILKAVKRESSTN